MQKRRPMTKQQSRKNFKHGAARIHKFNLDAGSLVKRGGIRL